MTVIVVDGPEKAGKTTLIRAIDRHLDGARVLLRAWGPVKSDVEYLEPLKFAVSYPGVAVWDRSWASEHVYGLLLDRVDHRLAGDPWLGEWLYGRAVQACGLRVMVTTDPALLRERRNATDLPVDPAIERFAFQQYADQHGWSTYDMTQWSVAEVAKDVVQRAVAVAMRGTSRPPVYCGPPGAPVVVVGEARNLGATAPGAWLPFTSRLTTLAGRALGENAYRVGWTNAEDVPPVAVRGAVGLVACGEHADQWCRYHVGHKNVLSVPHPASLYRFGKQRARIDGVEESVRQFVRSILKSEGVAA
jgi:hypothetical protein